MPGGYFCKQCGVTQIESLPSECIVCAKDKEIAALRSFVEATVGFMWDDDLGDGGRIQDLALELGLIREAPGGYDPKKHGYSFYADPGDRWYELVWHGEKP